MFVGFDFVAFEDNIPLKELSGLVSELKQKHPGFEPTVMYHAGESVLRKNMNCQTALAEGSKRLGHGLTLILDPEAMKMAKRKNILVEANPLSNYMLGYVLDLRWHPVSILKFHGFPIR